MAKTLYRRHTQLRSAQYGHGLLLMVAWERSMVGSRDFVVPVILQDPEDHGGAPRWPHPIYHPADWREAREVWKLITELPEFTQLQLSWYTDFRGFQPPENVEGLRALILDARKEALERWGRE